MTGPLLERARRGDPRAERELYDAHVDRVYRLVRGMVRDAEEAKDLVQRTFVKAFDRIEEFRGDAALSTWLHSIATSLVLDRARKRKRREGLAEDVATSPLADPDPSRGPGDPLLRRAVRREVEALDAESRALLLLFDVEGYGHEEIGEILGITAGASRVRLHRIRARLRERLSPLIEEDDR